MLSASINYKRHTGAAAVSGQNYSYGFDSIGNRTSANEPQPSFGTSSTYSANKRNEYPMVNTSTMAYDDDGNLALVEESSFLSKS